MDSTGAQGQALLAPDGGLVLPSRTRRFKTLKRLRKKLDAQIIMGEDEAALLIEHLPSDPASTVAPPILRHRARSSVLSHHRSNAETAGRRPRAAAL